MDAHQGMYFYAILMHHGQDKMTTIFGDILKFIFFNENACILKQISLKFVPKCLINNKPAFIQMMAYHQTGNKPLSEPTRNYRSVIY